MCKSVVIKPSFELRIEHTTFQSRLVCSYVSCECCDITIYSQKRFVYRKRSKNFQMLRHGWGVGRHRFLYGGKQQSVHMLTFGVERLRGTSTKTQWSCKTILEPKTNAKINKNVTILKSYLFDEYPGVDGNLTGLKRSDLIGKVNDNPVWLCSRLSRWRNNILGIYVLYLCKRVFKFHHYITAKTCSRNLINIVLTKDRRLVNDFQNLRIKKNVIQFLNFFTIHIYYSSN